MKPFKRKSEIVTSICILLLSAVILQGCGSGRAIRLDIEVSGCKIQLNDTFQDVYDNGLVICETDGTIIDLASCDEMAAKTYEIKTLHIGVPIDEKKATPSPVTVYPYNDSIASQPLSKCKIYQMNVSDGFGDPDEVSVTVNGKDIFQMEPKDALSHFDEIGISFDEDDRSKFLDDSSGGHMVKRQGKYMYCVDSEREMTENPDSRDYYDKDGNFDKDAYDAACKEAEGKTRLVVTGFKYEYLIDKSYD